jgi:hypothetical protein
LPLDAPDIASLGLRGLQVDQLPHACTGEHAVASATPDLFEPEQANKILQVGEVDIGHITAKDSFE